jgi:penicillin-binding protein 1A
MAHLLEGVVLRGTAEAAKSLHVAARRQDRHDGRVHGRVVRGLRPQHHVGVWVGYDEKKPLGRGETGAQAALPIWMDFMRVYIDKRADKKNPPSSRRRATSSSSRCRAASPRRSSTARSRPG